MKTVKEISKITGISVRTLHYYDEIQLLEPTEKNEAGYRLYSQKDLEQLQKILFFKELDFSLKDIKLILENPSLDHNLILSSQKEMLICKRDRLDKMIDLISGLMEGNKCMDFEIFSRNEIESMIECMIRNMDKDDIIHLSNSNETLGELKERYMKEAISPEGNEKYKILLQWYKSTDNIKQVVKNPLGKERMKLCQERLDDICKELIQNKSLDFKSETIISLANEYEETSKILFQMDDVRSLLIELAKTYINNEAIIEANDMQYGIGGSKYIGYVILSYYNI